MAAVAPGRARRSCPRGTLVMASKREIDPWVVAPAEIVANWAALVWKSGGAPRDAAAALELYPQDWKKGIPTGGLSKVKGPMGALCQAMGRLGWEMVSPTEFRDAKRYLWDAERHAPASIRWAARRDGADKAWSRTVNRTDMPGLGETGWTRPACAACLRRRRTTRETGTTEARY